MASKSAGLLMTRVTDGRLEVLLAHPGGPFWAKKEDGVWSIPKGEFDDDEEPLAAAKREFIEETGFDPKGPFLTLGTVTQKSGKVVHAWAFEGNCEPAATLCNRIEIEWPPRSGKKIEIPEVDRIEFFTLDEAAKRINQAQAEFLTRLEVEWRKNQR